LTESAELDKVTISRFTGVTANYTNFELDLNGDSQDWEFSIQADDRIFILSIPDYHLKHRVVLSGEVEYPGAYSIIDKQTKISDVIRRAGGFTEEANLRDAELIRMALSDVVDPEFERLKVIPVADMKDMEYEYFKAKSRERYRVIVDLQKLFVSKDSTQDIILRHNDQLFIPKLAPTVSVSGQVLNPGILEWKAGENYLYYINSAGGYSYNARKSKIRVIRASTGTWFKPNKRSEILIGDTIFVPEKPDRDIWFIYKDIILVLSQMATIVILIRTFR
jgi:protein involved in polysaccharide export with SLBB domain